MATTVGFSRKCRIVFEEHTEDRWLFVRESSKAIMELLGATAGLPAGARRVQTAAVDRYVLEDANWKVIYVRSIGQGPVTTSVHVTIEFVKLKQGIE